MADLNDGRPYHIPYRPWEKTIVPPVWPEAKEGDRVRIHNGSHIKEFEFRDGEWSERSSDWVRTPGQES
jgi:hypothetical protein